MEDMIREGQKSEQKSDRFDLFSSLLDANLGEMDGSSRLSDSELIGMLKIEVCGSLPNAWYLLGNIFIFLVAGKPPADHADSMTWPIL